MKHLNKRSEVFSQLINRLKCDVTDNKGNHCPRKVTHRVWTNRGDVYLCSRCLENIKAGAYKGINVKKTSEVS